MTPQINGKYTFLVRGYAVTHGDLPNATAFKALQDGPLSLARLIVLVLPDVERLPRQQGLAKNGIAELLTQHQSRAIRISVGDLWHDGRWSLTPIVALYSGMYRNKEPP
ncbi:MAG: hypothetical protein OXL68_19865 [Paracoccaceae bacterium]|nr:hypothetical protein [Paracoccaceae bacterium]